MIEWIEKNKLGVGALFLAHFLFWLMISRFVSPHPDLVDHWVWSRSLHLSYYEHPPMIAWVIRFFTTFLGSTPESLHLISLASNITILSLCYLICKSVFSQRTAIVYLLLLLLTPYFAMGSLNINIDSPLNVFWLLSIYCVLRFCEDQKDRWFYVIGILGGLGALSKYFMILFYISLGIWLLARQEVRRHLFRPPLYLAGLISLFLFSPVLIWNYQHDWISFRFQFGKALSGRPFGENFFAFTFVHMVLFSLVFSLSLYWHLLTKRVRLFGLDLMRSFLVVSGLVPLVFFSLSSLKGSIADPQWVTMAYVFLYMFLADFLANSSSRRLSCHLLPGFALQLTLISVILAHLYFHILPLDLRADTSLSSVAWEKTGKQIDELFAERGLPAPEYILSSGYQLASVLSLNLASRPWPYSMAKPERNQWAPIEKVKASSRAFAVCAPFECGSLQDDLRRLHGIEFVSSVGKVETRLLCRRLVRELEVHQMAPSQEL